MTTPESNDVETGLATGSDAGEPGGHLPGPPLGPGEQALLEALVADEDPPSEAPPEVVSAAEADAPLPGDDGGPQDDGLTPRTSNA